MKTVPMTCSPSTSEIISINKFDTSTAWANKQTSKQRQSVTKSSTIRRYFQPTYQTPKPRVIKSSIYSQLIIVDTIYVSYLHINLVLLPSNTAWIQLNNYLAWTYTTLELSPLWTLLSRKAQLLNLKSITNEMKYHAIFVSFSIQHSLSQLFLIQLTILPVNIPMYTYVVTSCNNSCTVKSIGCIS